MASDHSRLNFSKKNMVEKKSRKTIRKNNLSYLLIDIKNYLGTDLFIYMRSDN